MLWVICSENPLANERDTPPTTLKLLKKLEGRQTGIPDTLQWWLRSLDAPLASVDSIRGSKTSSDLREVRFVHQNGKRCTYIYIYIWNVEIVGFTLSHISMNYTLIWPTKHDLGIVSGEVQTYSEQRKLESDTQLGCHGDLSRTT